MAEANTHFDDETSNLEILTKTSINCIICKKSRCYKKYRRHLKTHVISGELKPEDVHKILFSCRNTRSDIKKIYQDKIQRGYVCHYETESKQECGHVILDLKHHLLTVHKLDRCCSLFEDLIEKGFSQRPLKRIIYTASRNIPEFEQNDHCRKIISSQSIDDSVANITILPTSSDNIPSQSPDIFNIETLSPDYGYPLRRKGRGWMCKRRWPWQDGAEDQWLRNQKPPPVKKRPSQSPGIFNTEGESDSDDCVFEADGAEYQWLRNQKPPPVKKIPSQSPGIFNIESESDSDDCVFETSFVPPQFNTTLTSSPTISHVLCGGGHDYCKSLQFLDTDKLSKEFHSFMQSKGGGGRRNTPVKGDISSFKCLVNEIGWKDFWNHNNLNCYISSATCSPSTSYGRLRVYERFIHFLRSQLPNLLPPPECMLTIESMLKALKETLGKDRHHRGKITMTASRDRMPHSLNVLRKWRLRRKTVEVKKLFPVSTSDRTFKLDESLFIKLRNFLVVEIILNNAQRSGIIEGMRIKEVLRARNNANEDNLHYMYIEHHKTGHIQPAIIYLDSEVYNFLFTFIMVVIPQLPQLEYTRSREDCHVFQTWQNNILHSSNVNHRFRSGLSLYGIDDPNGCPTHYRKAASTLISLHKPELQEILSQFMCHSRATTEKHYRSHMAHKGMYKIFKELGRCQEMTQDEVGINTIPLRSNQPSSLTFDNNEECSDDIHMDETVNNDGFEVGVHDCRDAPNCEWTPPLEGEFRDDVNCLEEIISLPKYSSKWNNKSIFLDQNEENTFFRVFENMVDDSIALRKVLTSNVCKLAQKSYEFSHIWERLVQHWGYESTSKKITDKIRTYGRNHRKDSPEYTS